MNLTESQQRAIDHRDGPLLVTASAGSGKTEVLARRCVSLIRERRCGVSELLVVTFTRAAAAEMRARIASGLRQAAATAASRDERAWLSRQQLLLDGAEIGTLDAWCARLVRANFAAASVDPSFRILGEQESALLRAECLRELLRNVYTAEAPLFARTRGWLERGARASDEFVRDAISALDAFAQRLLTPDDWLAARLAESRGPDEELRARAADVLDAALRDRVGECVALCDTVEPLLDSPTALRILTELREWLNQQAAAPDRQIAVPRAVGLSSLSASARESIDRVRRSVGRLRKQVAERASLIAVAPLAADWLAALLELTQAFRRNLAEAKRRRHAYEFDDVQRLALSLLEAPSASGVRGPTSLARELQRRYRSVLVDEFQDTSPLQVRLVELVTNAVRPDADLFLVGDVKQSIYGFRQAEPRLFAERVGRIRGGLEVGRVEPLQDNFRSNARLADDLNTLFARLLSSDLGGVDYDEQERMLARRDEPVPPASNAEPRLQIHALAAPPPKTLAPPALDSASRPRRPAESIEREARLAAQEILRLINRGETVVERGADGRPGRRALRFDDIVVLLRTARGKAARVARELRRAGVPAVAAGRESLLDSLEVAGVRNALRLIVNRRQDGALAACLLGPLGDCSETELFAIRRRRPERAFHDAIITDARANPEGGPGRLLARVADWRQIATYAPVGALVRAVVRDGALEHFAAGQRGGEHRVAALRAFQQLADGYRDSLSEFLAELDALEAQGSAPALTPPAARGVVRVMTIHAAKGLEFGVVWLLNAGARIAPRADAICCDEAAGIGLTFTDVANWRVVETAARSAALARTARREREEELRLLYVAGTRARERFYVVGQLSERCPREALEEAGAALGTPLPTVVREDAASVLEWTILAAAGGRLAVVDHPADAFADAPPPAQINQNPPKAAADAQWVARTAELCLADPDMQLAQQVAAVSVTLAKRGAGEQRLAADDDNPRAESATLRGPRFVAEAAPDGRDVGTAAHRFLRHADLAQLDSESACRRELERLVGIGQLGARDAELTPIADCAWLLASEVGAALRSAGSALLREQPFVVAPSLAGRGEPVLIRGVIDALLEREGGVWLLDYKTDRFNHAAAWERLAEYERQLQLYAAAVAQVTGRRVLRCTLVLLSARELREVDLAGVPRVLAELGLEATAVV